MFTPGRARVCAVNGGSRGRREVFAKEIYKAPRSWAERAYPQLIYFNEVDRGCHLAAWQEPALFTAEVRRRSGHCARPAQTSACTLVRRGPGWLNSGPLGPAALHAPSY